MVQWFCKLGKVGRRLGSMGYLAKNICQEFILVVEHLLEEDGEGYCILKSNVCNPFPTGYKLEIDVTEELNQKLASRYMQLIGILHWAMEIGQINIFLEVSLLSQYQANQK